MTHVTLWLDSAETDWIVVLQIRLRWNEPFRRNKKYGHSWQIYSKIMISLISKAKWKKKQHVSNEKNWNLNNEIRTKWPLSNSIRFCGAAPYPMSVFGTLGRTPFESLADALMEVRLWMTTTAQQKPANKTMCPLFEFCISLNRDYHSSNDHWDSLVDLPSRRKRNSNFVSNIVPTLKWNPIK